MKGQKSGLDNYRPVSHDRTVLSPKCCSLAAARTAAALLRGLYAESPDLAPHLIPLHTARDIHDGSGHTTSLFYLPCQDQITVLNM